MKLGEMLTTTGTKTVRQNYEYVLLDRPGLTWKDFPGDKLIKAHQGIECSIFPHIKLGIRIEDLEKGGYVSNMFSCLNMNDSVKDSVDVRKANGRLRMVLWHPLAAVIYRKLKSLHALAVQKIKDLMQRMS